MTKQSIDIDWWLMKAPYNDKRVALLSHTKEELADLILDYQYNSYCSDRCDKDSHSPSGKTIPYIGWFWRNMGFTNGAVSIGRIDCGIATGFTGFMGNNKWDYPERLLTNEELQQVIRYLDKGIANRGKEDEATVLRELWNYMQGLVV
jgi:hypothetical protein